MFAANHNDIDVLRRYRFRHLERVWFFEPLDWHHSFRFPYSAPYSSFSTASIGALIWERSLLQESGVRLSTELRAITIDISIGRIQ